MKKIIAIFGTVLVVALMLAACGTTSSSDNTTGNAGTNEALESASSDGGDYDVQTKYVTNDGDRIFGEAYVPDGADADNKVPLVILSHGLGGDHDDLAAYAQELANAGYAAYTFDFRGGTAGGNQSDGDSTEMSVMTEVSDLRAIVDAAQDWEFVNTDKIVLLGASQGGMVSALTAAQIPKRVAALVLLYPALSIVHDMHDLFDSKSDIPATYDLFGWITVGRNYAADVWDLDVYKEIAKYTGPVLIVHGTDDDTVDISYSRRAARTYKNAEFHAIDGAGHGFSGDDYSASEQYIVDFLSKQF